ncbi:MAG: DUF4367 domain-containing protein [Lachnospiraceae bacterium]|jgi:hypothetical protein
MSKLEKFVQEPDDPVISNEEDAKIKEFVRREYLREAEEIERALPEDDGTDAVPEDMYDQIIQKLKAHGTCFDEDGPAEENPKKHTLASFPHPYRAAKRAAVACIICLGIFGVSMTSEANRAYMMKQVDSLVGNEVNVKVNNSGDREITGVEESEAAAEIEAQLLVEVPTFLVKPDGMKFEEAEILTEIHVALMNYVVNDQIAYLYIATNEEDAARVFALDGELVAHVENEYQGIDIAISALQSDDQEKPLYIAQWTYKNNYYIFNAMMDLEELQSILSNMLY